MNHLSLFICCLLRKESFVEECTTASEKSRSDMSDNENAVTYKIDGIIVSEETYRDTFEMWERLRQHGNKHNLKAG